MLWCLLHQYRKLPLSLSLDTQPVRNTITNIFSIAKAMPLNCTQVSYVISSVALLAPGPSICSAPTSKKQIPTFSMAWDTV